MSGHRPFDDDRWSDAEGFAACFLCGRNVDPRDPHRGTYTPNVKACDDSLVVHIDCVEPYVAERDGKTQRELRSIAVRAVREMGRVQVKRALEAANVSTTSPLGT